MCGIVGIVGPGARKKTASRMTRSISHRGPDGEGFWVDDGIALGHRRLSIIDLEGGYQPMHSSTGRWVITFNGEIYNYKTLRKEQYPDYSYRNRSDTEAILAGLEAEGAACLSRLNGIFAIAAWDRDTETLLLARDPVGVKPLYFGRAGDGSFVFASEVKGLECGGVSMIPDMGGLAAYMDVRFVPGSRTAFEGVTRILPGQMLIVSKAGEITSSARYSGESPEISRNISRRDALTRVKHAMLDAVERQLVADVPVGILLSGGVDSAAVAAAARAVGHPVTTFCVGYSGEHWSNEFAEAAETARVLGTEHVELTIDETDAIAAMSKLVRHLEEPVVTTSVFSYYLLCEQVASHRKVVLTGQGADEPWAGYNRHRAAYLLPWLRRVAALIPKGLIRRTLGYDVGERLIDALNADDEIATWRALHSLFPGTSVAECGAAPDFLNLGPKSTENALKGLLKLLPNNGSLFDRQLALDTRTSLPENLLMLGDKLSMAHGLEVRVPFLDHEYLHLVESLPGHFKRHGLFGGEGKYLHKLVCQELLPKSIVRRKKKGFQTPIETWFRGGLGDHIEGLVAEPGSFARQLIGPEFVRNLVRSHRARASGNLERQLFAIWMLEEWGRVFVTSKAGPSK
jgi:asparagine synthase (glutamine-hydrolysing)